MNGPSESGICADECTGPASLDSEYDEYLAIPDIEGHTFVNFSNDEKPEKCGTEILPADDLTALPYKTVYKDPVRFKSPQRSIFIPGQEIELQFTEYERSITTHLLYPNLYTIELKHGDFTWTLKKRYKHIQHLHQQLRIFRATLNIPFPTKTHKERRHSFKHEATRNKTGGKSKGVLPRFPSRPEALVPDEQVETRMRQLEEYLRNLLKIPLYRDHHETVLFLEVSQLSFVRGLGPKGKECEILKRTRSAHPGSAGCNLCGLLDRGICVRCNYVCSDVCGKWRHRWLVVKESFIAYIRPKDGRVNCVILYDSGFEVSSGIFSTGLRRGLHIINLSRQIVIKCPTRRTTRECMAHIKETAHNSDFTHRNRYTSFAPVRSDIRAGWFVDGSDYMAAVADAMEQAKEEIFIADWWLSPEIFMKRPPVDGLYWRLDKILQRKAAAGVKVFILLYKEVELALGINSYYSKQTLVGSHPENIKVLRHPDHAKAGVFLWAHHEKIVIVDQNIAFLGGIDLCYGRWDDQQHRLTDLGSMSTSLTQLLTSKLTSSRHNNIMISHNSLLQLAKASNTLGVGVAGFTAISSEYVSTPVEKESLQQRSANFSENETSYEVFTRDPVMNQPSPENVKCNTPELERKNILTLMRENFRNRDWMTLLSLTSDDGDSDDDKGSDDDKKRRKEKKENENINGDMKPQERYSLSTDQTFMDGDSGDEVNSPSNCMPNGLAGCAKFWVGKDYTNFIVKDFNNLELPYQDLVDRTRTPRMPWHDIGCMVQGAAARDVARHFIMRWNAIKLEKCKINPAYPYLLPKGYRDFAPTWEVPDTRLFNVSAQIVRSVSHWSAGFMDMDTWEASIHEAYVDAIAKSQHFVYIENQFFISLASMQVKNQVCDAIYKRIVRAHREGTKYRVFVVLPLLPGFEGEVGTPTGTALHAITHWNYASISRGKDSLLVRLKDAGINNTSDYITFNGLRNHSVLNGDLVTELIYVHSKLLIADDRLVICGSANINDRSLLGKRDSEIAVVVQDQEFQEHKNLKNGTRIISGRFCGTLRRRLFREHLGLLTPTDDRTPYIKLSDPTSDAFYHDVWRKTAQNNTEIYEKVFNCIPSDRVTNFQSLKRYQDEIPLCCTEPISAAKLLQGIQGHLVMLPLNFLCNEVLTPNASSVTGMMPTSLWT